MAAVVIGNRSIGYDYAPFAHTDFASHGSKLKLYDASREVAIEAAYRNYNYYRGKEPVWKMALLGVLSSGQIYYMHKLYEENKKLADKTFAMADKQWALAERTYAVYAGQFKTQEVKMGSQLASYFSSSPVDYEVGDKFLTHTANSYSTATDEFHMRSDCTYSSDISKQFVLDKVLYQTDMKNRGNRFAETIKDYRDGKWLEYRSKFVQSGSPIPREGQQALTQAFQTMAGFKADPGAAMSQLLGTISNTLGMFSAKNFLDQSSFHRSDHITFTV